jgi:hypothetical protein
MDEIVCFIGYVTVLCKVIHSFIYLQSMAHYMDRKPLNIEIANEKTDHMNNIITY